MRVERRWGAASIVWIRVLVAGVILLVAGCLILGSSSRARQTAAISASPSLSSQSGLPIPDAGQFSGTNAAPDTATRARSLLAGLPLYFEPNQGQENLDPTDPRAKFISRGADYSLFLGSDGAILSLASHEHPKRAHGMPELPSAPSLEFLQMRLAGATPGSTVSAMDELAGKSNYFIGNNPAKWRSGVPHFAHVCYENIYPGINLVFYGREGKLEYDFQVGPGADPAQAELEFDGAKKFELKDGSLIIRAERGSVALEAPRVYQEVAGKQQPVEASFVLRGHNRAGFAIGAYDHSRELVIDPILNFSTYFGGSGDELSSFVAVDGNFNIYLTGSTTSTNLPVTGGSFQQTLKGARNVYVAKITPPLGSIAATLDDVTYLGGTGTDSPADIQVDAGGFPYLAGTTSSGDFPTTATNAYQQTPLAGSTGTTHAFVTKLKNDFTSLLYSSYLSGNGTDAASGMTIDPSGNLYVTGTTTSTNLADPGQSIEFPASSAQQANATAFQQNSLSAIQFFVTKVSTSGSRVGSIAYSTYFGGANFNPPPGTTLPTVIGGGIAVDLVGNIYFTGTTNFTYTGCSGCGTTDFPILNAYQPCLDSAPPTTIIPPQSCPASTDTAPDAFVAKLNPVPGSQLLWSTYIGGSGTDSGVGIALDTGAANVYVVGTTNSPDFVNPLLINTYASFQQCLNNLPQTPIPPTGCTMQTNPPNDAFVAKLTNPTITQGSSTTVALSYFSYLGGADNEAGNAIVVDSNSGAVITGSTQSPFTNTAGTFPVTPNPSSIQSSLYDAQAAFIARINTAAVVGGATTASWATYFGGICLPLGNPACSAAMTAGTGIALDVNQDTYLAGDTNSPVLTVAKPLTQGAVINGGYDAFVTQLGTAVSLSISGVLGLGTNQSFISAGNPATFTYTITNNGPDLASNITVLATMSPGVTGIPLTNITGTISTGTCGGGTSSGTGISCGPISLQSGSTATLTISATPTANSGGASPESFNGGTIQVLAPGNIVLAETSVTAQMSDFRMTVSPLNQAVSQAGLTATYQVQLTPSPLFGSAISLSCSGNPTGTSCNFSPSNSITISSASGATATLNIPTTPRPITPTTTSLLARHFYALWMAIPLMAIFGIGGDRRRRRILGIFMLCTVFALLVLLPGCSHSTTQTPVSGTPAGTYTITVTASSGTDSKSQTVTLSVP